MKSELYKITDDVAGFETGEQLSVIARYGHTHVHEMLLETESTTDDAKQVIVTDRPTGFSERDILDPAMRVGDWHEYAVTFDIGGAPTPDSDTDSPIKLTVDELSSIADPVEPPA